MTGFSSVHNGGAYARGARAVGSQTATAGGSGDNTVVNTDWVSRASPKGIAQSLKVLVSFSTVLAAGATLKFGGKIQDAIDAAGASAADYPASGQVIAPTTVATGPAGGGTVTGVFEMDVDLVGAREFVRAAITPDLSASGTDTLTWNAVYVFFGDQRGPTTKSPVNLASPDLI